jgi:hypothetical protein
MSFRKRDLKLCKKGKEEKEEEMKMKKLLEGLGGKEKKR